jgi:hypothetical protein
LTWPLPTEWDDAQLEARLFQRVGDLVGVSRPLPNMAWLHQELKRPGVTAHECVGRSQAEHAHAGRSRPARGQG